MRGHEEDWKADATLIQEILDSVFNMTGDLAHAIDGPPPNVRRTLGEQTKGELFRQEEISQNLRARFGLLLKDPRRGHVGGGAPGGAAPTGGDDQRCTGPRRVRSAPTGG